MGTSSLLLKRRLQDLAEAQGGYFTASQAISVGYKDAVHPYHVRNGDWERAGWGLYRLTKVPKDFWSELHRILLWSRDRKGIPRGVFCGQTAQAILHRKPHLANLEAVELYVPRSFRRSAKIPENILLIFEDLCEKDVTSIDGIPVTMRVLRINPNILDYTSVVEDSYSDAIARGED
jgi:hypothetical protein